MFEHILIPTDGSETASNAAETGIELAAEQGATVHGLYVVKPIHGDEGGAEDALEALEAAGERTLATLAEQAENRGLATTTDVTTGTPHREILEYIETNEIDLVVMGTHGRTGIGRYLLGSVTEKVVRLADIPVLTIRPPRNANR
ncbi:universal stress protein [Salinadaptatus halalkaliphilus]|uniref:Universal stress protein n=1 Tax=Salinadaptatus halalkaliphilus TaxID=2419781 RepID=A0A4S3TIJ4_9EURY|nr:universal stress protein [Salinadaptatus halalkaliphilus]THE63884.1 universal stress protein [Salinadaptatus halalkaliphilus]